MARILRSKVPKVPLGKKCRKWYEKNFFEQNLKFQRSGTFYVLFTLFWYLRYFWKNIESFWIWSIFGQKFLPIPKMTPKIKKFSNLVGTFYPFKGYRNFCQNEKSTFFWIDEILIKNIFSSHKNRYIRKKGTLVLVNFMKKKIFWIILSNF